MFEDLVAPITELLNQYHQLMSGQVKAEIWEEICAKALVYAGYGSDWTPDFNHAIGTDQTTNGGIKISNKGGKFSNDLNTLTISGSRLTRFGALDEKIEHIHNADEDYIFCLATTKPFVSTYYFTVIASSDLDYGNATWSEKIGTRGRNEGNVTGWGGNRQWIYCINYDLYVGPIVDKYFQ